MAAQWSVEIEEFFINEIYKKRYLWDFKDPDFFKNTLKHHGYEEIGTLMSSKWPSHASLFNTELLKQKFVLLKNYYCQKKRMLKKFVSGASDVPPKLAYYNRLGFLHGVEPPKTSSHLDILVKCEITPSESSSQPEEASLRSCMLEETSRLSTPKSTSDCARFSNKENKGVQTVDDMYNQAPNLLQELNAQRKDLDGEDGYSLFIVEYMRSMSRKKREKARIKIQKILYEIKFDEDSDEE